MNDKPQSQRPPQTVEAVLSRLQRPKKAIVTAGMPYANGPLHLGHLAGAQIPADICSRWLKLLIGADNVLFVCGTDDHGSTSEVAAISRGVDIHDFIHSIHVQQEDTLQSYNISLDAYSGTSSREVFPQHTENCQKTLRALHRNNFLQKKTSQQWFDPKMQRFLPDRYVQGTCPNPDCESKDAYSDECGSCGKSFFPTELLSPRSIISDGIPELRPTDHWHLDMWRVTDLLISWIQSKKSTWRKGVYNEVINTVLPSFSFGREHEDLFKSSEVQASIPKHKRRYAPGKKITAQFNSLSDLHTAESVLGNHGISTTLVDGWAHRAITRDVSWGIPLPPEIDPSMSGKTLYVWPDSLIAPLAFCQSVLKKRGDPDNAINEYWCDKNSKIYQFVGQDNVFFYVLMQAALWIGSQDDPNRLPESGDNQLTDIIGAFHLHINGEKMSKSTGNFFTGNQLLNEKGYTADQVRYFLALLSLSEKSSNFEFDQLDERNKFLAGPMNAAFEKPISAVHSQFGGQVPNGNLLEKAEKETYKIVQRYTKAMQIAEYSKLLYALENYARVINSLFSQFKPHDDRFPEEERRDALYSCFYILKNLMIMLSPFVPETMERLRTSLNLPESVMRIDELGTPIEAGHQIGDMNQYFPPLDDSKGPSASPS